MWPFTCNHPASSLHVKTDATVVDSPDAPEDYQHVTYHLYCLRCDAPVEIGYAKVKGGVDAMMKRVAARVK